MNIKEEYRELLRETYHECRFHKFCSAQEQTNKPKNRYSDVLPKEDTRVKLSIEPDRPGSDYINANYIIDDISDSDKKYICCQAPLPSTFNDFWKMIWEQNVGTIVTLIKLKENGKIKGERYWPNKEGSCNTYGKFKVELYKTTFEDHLIINLFILKFNNEERKVVQFYFRGWPDFGVPQSTLPIRKLCHMIDEYNKGGDISTTTVIHCSAGIGRTGTFLAILMALDIISSEEQRSQITRSTSSVESSTLDYDDDYELNAPEDSSSSYGTDNVIVWPNDETESSGSYVEEDYIYDDDLKFSDEMIRKLPPIKDIVLSLRRQRNHGMVQTEDQYRFIYRSVLDEISYGKPKISLNLLNILKL